MESQVYKELKFQSLIGTVQRIRTWNCYDVDIVFQSLIGTVQHESKSNPQYDLCWVSISHRYGSTTSQSGCESLAKLFQSLIGTVQRNALKCVESIF